MRGVPRVPGPGRSRPCPATRRLDHASFCGVRRGSAPGSDRRRADRGQPRGKTYDLTGHDAVSWAQLAELASARAGKPVPYRSIDDTEAAARMEAAGIPAPYIPSMLGFYAAYRAGWSGTPSGHIEQLAGRPATPTLDAIAAVLAGTAR
jgi:hypothetical protein